MERDSYKFKYSTHYVNNICDVIEDKPIEEETLNSLTEENDKTLERSKSYIFSKIRNFIKL